MTNKTTSLDQESEQKTTSFAPPRSREEFHQDVVTTFLTPVRIIGWMTDWRTACRILGKEDDENVVTTLGMPDMTSDELGVSYQDIASTAFAQAMEVMYDFAYFGRIDESREGMDYEGICTWIAEILCDLANSNYASEWDSYGGLGAESAARCLRVAETANARRVLEGEEPFSYFHQRGKDADAVELDALTVRQMALLADMEEMSIRAAANPKRANPLVTFSDNGKTRIASDVAREWLKSKGRYVAVTRTWSAGEIDLATTRFSSADAVLMALSTRCASLMEVEADKGALANNLNEIGVKVCRPFGRHLLLEIDQETLSNPQTMATVASLLQLPEDLLVLRIREALLREELSSIETQIKSRNEA